MPDPRKNRRLQLTEQQLKDLQARVKAIEAKQDREKRAQQGTTSKAAASPTDRSRKVRNRSREELAAQKPSLRKSAGAAQVTRLVDEALTKALDNEDFFQDKLLDLADSIADNLPIIGAIQKLVEREAQKAFERALVVIRGQDFLDDFARRLLTTPAFQRLAAEVGTRDAAHTPQQHRLLARAARRRETP